MVRGEFTLDLGEGNALVVPNQFTIYGWQQLLRSAFQGSPTTWWVGLCAANPTDSFGLANIDEPTIGVNGYARQELQMTQPNWPKIGTINGESYIESRQFTFTPDGGPFDRATNRLFITDGIAGVAISSALWTGLIQQEDQLNQHYRLYFR